MRVGWSKVSKQRIDAQYYLKYVEKDELIKNYKEAQKFVLLFKEKILRLNEKEISQKRVLVDNLLKEKN